MEAAGKLAPGRVSVEATLPLLEILAKGPTVADAAAAAFLGERSLQIWQTGHSFGTDRRDRIGVARRSSITGD